MSSRPGLAGWKKSAPESLAAGLAEDPRHEGVDHGLRSGSVRDGAEDAADDQGSVGETGAGRDSHHERPSEDGAHVWAGRLARFRVEAGLLARRARSAPIGP